MKTATTTKTPAKKQAKRKPLVSKAAKTLEATGFTGFPKDKPKRVRKPKLKVADTADERKKVSAQSSSKILQEKVAQAKAAQAATQPQVTPTPKDQLRIMARDLPEDCMALLKHWIDISGLMDHSSVDLTDMLPSPGSTIKKGMIVLVELKKRLLMRTVVEDVTQIEWVHLTTLGEELKAYLTEATKPASPMVEGLKAHVEATVASGTGKVASQPKRVAAPKINRSAVRYEAVAWVMAKVKPATFTKAHYPHLVKDLEEKYAPLYSKLKTPEKRYAYSIGIMDFCLAACRKNHLCSNA